MSTSQPTAVYVTRVLATSHTHSHGLALQRDREDGFSIDKLVETEEASMAILATLTLLGFALRFYKINHPDQVVYVQREL